MKRIPFSLKVISIAILILGGIGLAIILSWIQFEEIFYNFYAFVFGLVIISFLAIIGAMFVGMFISHRIFSSREFTGFEEEMLKMRRDVEDIKEKIDEMNRKD
ncbi:MAG: hypothetical protein KGY66_01685 [Candidatus Thermoplasmatota archaeon]|nr:hypothetical protein [Candidatus Thermoplasmatota archaeon]MBS3789608.1 hypothetical protein [Candidatus Thermoplasmatota archaeon]